jgi:hypothetical protein
MLFDKRGIVVDGYNSRQKYLPATITRRPIGQNRRIVARSSVKGIK